MKIINILIVALSLVACSVDKPLETTATQVVLRVDNKKFDSILNVTPNIQLIDVRTQGEFNSGKIEGAKNFDIRNGDFVKHILDLEKETPIALYCHGGNRSSQARKMLEEKGFSFIVELEKGFSQYSK
ncbi:MAG: rhodanese-like domain-containing protein [Lishizhenia sp.]